MTVSYTGDVANASGFGCFNKILLKWKGSVYKLIYKWKQSRETFELLVTYCHHQLSSIPLTFVLGFYVSLIVSRWWRQYTLLPWPDSMAILVVTFITGKEERQRLMRRNIIRYILLSYCMATRAVSFRVKKRFPDLQHLLQPGLLREDEFKVLTNLDGKITANKWFLPLVWAADICARALAEGFVRPQTVRALIAEICSIREKLTGVMNHDWVSVPLVYTQVVTLAVYFYFTAALIGAQWINPESEEAYKTAHGIPVTEAGTRLDMFYPFFLTIQFAFYFGWLKVAETLINPFGEDDDDFELNRLIDRHCQVGYMIVEHEETPELLQDKYWDSSIPQDIPYTIAAEKYKADEYVGSAEATLLVKESEKAYADISMKGAGKTPKLYLNGEKHPFDTGSAVCSGIYEEVGSPMMQKVALLTRKMAFLGSMSGCGVSNISQKSHNKSQLSLYDKLSRNLSIFDNGSSTSLGGPTSRIRKNSRQRSVSDVIKPRLEELPQAVIALDNDAFQVEDTEFDEEVEPVQQVFVERTRLETISENQDSPNITLARQCFDRRPDVRRVFGVAEFEIPARHDVRWVIVTIEKCDVRVIITLLRSKGDILEVKELQESGSSASFTDPVFV